MVFSVKQAVADAADLPPFPFEDAEGEQRELPHLKMFTSRQAARILFGGEFEEVLAEVDEEYGAELGGILMDLPGGVAEELVREWMKHSGIDQGAAGLGKPVRPSRSTNSTGTRSKRTSRSGGSRSTR